MTEEFQWQLSIAEQLKASDSLTGFGNSLEAHRSVITAISCFAGSPDDYSGAISRAIGQGDDVDTLAAMAGGISGARLGMNAIPPHQIESLENTPKGRDYIVMLVKRLYYAHQSPVSAPGATFGKPPKGGTPALG